MLKRRSAIALVGSGTVWYNTIRDTIFRCVKDDAEKKKKRKKQKKSQKSETYATSRECNQSGGKKKHKLQGSRQQNLFRKGGRGVVGGRWNLKFAHV